MKSTVISEIVKPNHGIQYYLRQFWVDVGDPRTLHLPLIRDGPWLLIAILSLYLLFATRIGPKMMKNREPYQLRGVMFVYNTAMVMINLYFFFEALKWIDYGMQLYNFRWPDSRDTSERTMTKIWSFYLYFITKFVDLLDTIFFVLRKKQRQISVLHVYHHISVPVIGYISNLLCPVMPVLGLFALLNCVCHVLMYSYYALTAFGPQLQKYLWWKKYITQIQLAQFAIIGLYGVLLNLSHINYPFVYRVLPVSQGCIFFMMFANFYKKSYTKQIPIKLN